MTQMSSAITHSGLSRIRSRGISLRVLEVKTDRVIGVVFHPGPGSVSVTP